MILNARKIRLISSKRAQEGGVFGLSFGMIFAIILIVFFIIVAFIAIKAFLDFQKCTQVGSFFSDLKDDVNDAFRSDSSSFNQSYFLPSGIEYVCFINISASAKSYNAKELMLYENVKESRYIYADNLYLYAPKTMPCAKLTNTKIEHIDLSWKNPICIPVIRNYAIIKFEKKFDSPLVKVFE